MDGTLTVIHQDGGQISRGRDGADCAGVAQYGIIPPTIVHLHVAATFDRRQPVAAAEARVAESFTLLVVEKTPADRDAVRRLEFGRAIAARVD